MEIQDFISVQEAVKISGYNGRTISYLCKHGKLEGAVKVANRWLIPRKALEEYQPGPQGYAAVWEHRRAAQKVKAEKGESATIMRNMPESSYESKIDIERELLRRVNILIRKIDSLEKRFDSFEKDQCTDEA